MKVTTKIKDGKTYIRVRFKRLVPIFGDQYGYQNSMDGEFMVHTGLKLTKENSAIITPLINTFKDNVERAISILQLTQKPITKKSVIEQLNFSLLPAEEKIILEENNKPLIDMYRKFLDYKSASIKKSTMNGYKSILRVLEKFQKYDRKKLHVDDFSNKKFEQLIQFSHHILEHHDNHISKNAKRLKQFLVWAKPDNDWGYVKHKAYTPEVIYLHHEEFEMLKIARLPTHSNLNKIRDLFLFCCVTGIAYSDTQRIDNTNINQGLIEYRRSKNNSVAITPLNHIAEKILLKYGGSPPTISNQKYNLYLKVLFNYLELERPVKTFMKVMGKTYTTVEPLCDVITSHVARKTFVMLLLRRKVPIQDIMDMTGHADYKSIKPYINVHRDHLKKYKNIFS